MKIFCKKMLITMLIVTIFTTYVPAFSSIVFAIEELKTDIIEDEDKDKEKLENENLDNEKLEEDKKATEVNTNKEEKIIDKELEKESEQEDSEQEESIEKATKPEGDEGSNIIENTNESLNSEQVILKGVNSNAQVGNIELDEKIKKSLTDSGYDSNNDGEFSKEELENENITYLSVNCDDGTVDFSGVENIINLREIYFYNLKGSLNVYNLSNLVNLRELGINGNVSNIENLELLTNLTELSCYFYDNNFKPDISDKIEKLKNLENLSIEGNYTLNFSKIRNLSKLKYLSIGGWYTQDLLDCEAIGSLKSLESLSIRYYKLNNLKGLENLANLNTLTLGLRQDESVDVETIKKLTSLKNLFVDSSNASDIEWLKNINGLDLLRLSCYSDLNNLTQEFFDTLNSLDTKKIEFHGTTRFNCGEIELDKENEINLKDIPLIKAVTDPNSKLYNGGSELEFYVSDYQNNENNVRIDNENSKMYFTPKEETKRYAYIYGGDGLNIKVEWQSAADNQVPELSEKLKQALINNSYDTDHNGELSMAELNSDRNNYLYIYFNRDEKVDLTGIEYVKYLNRLSLSCYDTIDFSCLSELKNLRYLYLSGKCDTSTLYLLPQLTELSLSLYSNDTAANLDDLKNLKNLVNLSIYGLKDSSMSALNNLTNLCELTIRCNNKTKININEFSNLKNLNKLTLYNVDASDLNGLEKLTSLKDLTIEQARGYYENIDKTTLQKLANLESLSIVATNDISWLNKLSNLKKITLSGGSDYDGIEMNQEFINKLKNISAAVKFNGRFNYNIGNVEVGKEISLNINDIPIFKELTDKNSKFYANNLNINCNSYSENNNYTYDSTNKILKIKVNDISNCTASFYTNYSLDNEYCYFNLNVKWKGYIQGDKTKLVTINDDNFRNELLKNNDIDGDEKITEHDMINISELNLANKNISDITGIEKAINIHWFDFSNNKISDATPLINLMANNECYGYLDNNYIESLEGLENLNFSNVDLSNNYIDFSDNSKNLRILEEYITKAVNEEFNNNEELAQNISKEEYTNSFKSRILGCYKIQKYGSVAERNDTLQLEQPLFNKLSEIGFDTNSDGKISKGELNDGFINNTDYYENLDLSNLGISNIENLKYLANVYQIDLSGNNISDISPLKEVKDLSWINLNNNKIQNIESVQDFFNVSVLKLANNKIKNIEPLQYLRQAKVVYMGEGTGLFAGGMEPYRVLDIDLANNEIEDISVLNKLITLSTINLSENKITDISSLLNYDFNALYKGFEEYEFYGEDGVRIDVSKNYIDSSNSKNIETINYFENNNSKIEIRDQHLKLTDDQSNIIIETYGDATAKIKVDVIETDGDKPKEVSQKIGKMEIVYAANISIVEGEYSGKIKVKIPLDKKLNGLLVKVLHQKENGTVEEFNEKVKDASVTVEVDELSPFYVAYDKDQYKQGDVNGDGKVNAGDYVAVLNYVRKKITLTEEQLKRADANGDKKVNAGDYVTILNIVRGKI